jgi:hypothetical protein
MATARPAPLPAPVMTVALSVSRVGEPAGSAVGLLAVIGSWVH